MGKLTQIKTKETEASAEDFIKKIPDEQKRKDCLTIIKMMEKATKATAKLWGSSIIGFGNLRYKSPRTGREVDWFTIGFSPRKANITIYLMNIAAHAAALNKLGKHKTSGGCLYINKMEDVDTKILQEVINSAVNKKKQ